MSVSTFCLGKMQYIYYSYICSKILNNIQQLEDQATHQANKTVKKETVPISTNSLLISENREYKKKGKAEHYQNRNENHNSHKQI